MATHFADRLIRAIHEKGAPICVGLDPVYERLPAALRARGVSSASSPTDQSITRVTWDYSDTTELKAIEEFCLAVIDIVAPMTPVLKINSAYFERYHAAGIELYDCLIEHAHTAGMLVIGDCKRGDVGHTAELYAEAHLSDSPRGADAVTLHSYLGFDAISPFINRARKTNRGLFILVQTSNPSARQVQAFVNTQGLSLSEHVAEMVNAWASESDLIGESGFSCLGAVVASLPRRSAQRMREIMPQCIFLVPGYGAQGCGPEDVQCCFDQNRRGAIVNASRSILYAYEHEASNADWKTAIAQACMKFKREMENS